MEEDSIAVNVLLTYANKQTGTMVSGEGHVFLNEFCLTIKDLPDTHKPTGPCGTFHREKFFDSSLLETWVLLLNVSMVFFFLTMYGCKMHIAINLMFSLNMLLGSFIFLHVGQGHFSSFRLKW